MDAVKFLKTINRMQFNIWGCDDYFMQELILTCRAFNGQETAIVEKVERWAQEHPAKTRPNDFLEKYPDATLDKSGIPEGICVKRLGYKGIDCDDDGFCDQCWNRPIE